MATAKKKEMARMKKMLSNDTFDNLVADVGSITEPVTEAKKEKMHVKRDIVRIESNAPLGDKL